MPRSIAPRPTIAGASVEVVQSLPVEMIAAVIAIARSRDSDRPWVADLISAFGENRVDEISLFCKPLRYGMDLIELTADAPNSNDPESFVRFVGDLTDRELTYYLLGRMYTKEQIPEVVTAAAVTQLLRETDTADSAYHEGAEFYWADDVPATRDEIVSTLRSVWDLYLKPRMSEVERRWQDKSRELNEYIERNGAPALWQLVSDGDDLPAEIPAGHPYTRIRFVPSCLTIYGHNYLFGFGEVVVVFSCEKSLADADDRRRATEDTLAVLKALSDRNRLRLLRLVAKTNCTMNGKQMAELLKLSPSVVSRHLGQLRAAGLVEEQSPDNRNITYSLKPETIDRLSVSLKDYLTHEAHG